MGDVDILKTSIESSTVSTSPSSAEEAEYPSLEEEEQRCKSAHESIDSLPNGRVGQSASTMGVPSGQLCDKLAGLTKEAGPSTLEVGVVCEGVSTVGCTEEGGSSSGRRGEGGESCHDDQSAEVDADGSCRDGRVDGGDASAEVVVGGRSENQSKRGTNGDNSGSVDNNEGATRKKKHRRGKSKKRKWKPYNKLTWEEKRVLEQREAQRAQRIRAEMFAHGRSVAPYNTTQFLMEDHNVNLKEPDLAPPSSGSGHSSRQRRDSNGASNVDDSDHFYSSPEDEEEFMQKEFSEAYENIHAERLSTMTKAELIQEYLQLEDRVDKLEQQQRDAPTATDQDRNQVLEKVRIFQEEIRKLHEENQRLREENARLQSVAESSQ